MMDTPSKAGISDIKRRAAYLTKDSPVGPLVVAGLIFP